MSKRILILGFVLAFAMGGVLLSSAEDAKDAEKVEYTYVGVKNCKMCHNKEATGAQYSIWEKSAHANAYAVLASEESVAKAKEMGIEDPQKDAKCLSCHITAFSVMDDLENQKITLEEGVSCESCHGPGSGYKSKKTMQGLTDGTIEAASVGLLVPDEKTCLGCHKEEGNPFHKEFNYEEAVKKIAHPIPAGE
jgi:hypothetical protein